MKIIVYNEKGMQVEKLEDLLVPKPTLHEGTLYIFYEVAPFTVVSKLVRTLDVGEVEDVVAVKTKKSVTVYEELPEPIAEKLGIGKEQGVQRKVEV